MTSCGCCGGPVAWAATTCGATCAAETPRSQLPPRDRAELEAVLAKAPPALPASELRPLRYGVYEKEGREANPQTLVVRPRWSERAAFARKPGFRILDQFPFAPTLAQTLLVTRIGRVIVGEVVRCHGLLPRITFGGEWGRCCRFIRKPRATDHHGQRRRQCQPGPLHCLILQGILDLPGNTPAAPNLHTGDYYHRLGGLQCPPRSRRRYGWRVFWKEVP